MIGEKSWKDIERELDEDFTSFTSVLKWTVGALLLTITGLFGGIALMLF
jgi:hypothetical protein